MGLTKRALEEFEQLVWEETDITFTCPECGELSDGSAEIPAVYEDVMFDHPISVSCICCDSEFDARYKAELFEDAILLENHPTTKVNYEPVYMETTGDWEHFDEWEDDYYFLNPKEPMQIFIEAHKDLSTICDTLATEDGEASINRMIFTQSFSIFEAYLCDTYLNLVFKNTENQAQFIENHKEMKKVSYTAKDLFANSSFTAEEILKKKITQLIKKTLFHNLNHAQGLFSIYKITMFANDGSKNLLFNAVEKRHHCVHRNGNDLDGNRLKTIDKDYCKEILDAIHSSVEIIFITQSTDKEFAEQS